MAERAASWAIVVGIVVVVAGAVGAIALWFGAEARLDDNVASFARAPVGCDTTLEFASTGEFVLFVETHGRLGDVDGDCDAVATYARSSLRTPRPDVTLIDRRGDELQLRTTGGAEYDRDGFTGTAYRLVVIDRPGAHVLTVGETDGEPFVVAVGRDPNRGVATLRWGAVASLITGLVAGPALLAFGSRRTATPVPVPAVAASAWPGAPGWPAGPPTTPPTMPLPAPSRPPGEPSAGPWGPPTQ